MTRREDALRLGRTLRHLRPEQAAHRARLRTQKLALSRQPHVFEKHWTRDVPSNAGWPASFEPIDRIDRPHVGTVDDLARNRFTLVGETHDIETAGGWRPDDRSQLFRYNLHYFEWAWTLAASDRDDAQVVFADLWKSWRADTTFGKWDEWSPYVVALRAWVLCGVFDTLVRGTDTADDVRSQIGLHAGFVAANLELDVGGNHLVKDLKALIGLGVFLGDEQLIGRGRDLLASEVEHQVLPDGGHYERSASYHCQVMGDLLDVGRLCRSADLPAVRGLDSAVDRMRTWLGIMVMPDGDVPLFGDATLVGQTRIAALGPTPPPTDRLIHLEDSGYVVCRPDDRLHVIVDVGPPCPPDLPAHAQAGCLAFVAAVDGKRTIVDTGVSTYVGDRRAYERSTAAHNTVEVAEVDQTEVWSSFRAGRLATPTVHSVEIEGSRDDGVLTVDASHDGYRHLEGGPIHRRRFEIGDGRIVLRDSVDGGGFHRLFSRLFLAPGIDATLTEDGTGPDVLAPPFSHVGTVSNGEKVPAWIVYASVAQSFGERQACRSLWWEIWDDLPQEFVTDIVLGDPLESNEARSNESGMA